MKSTTIYLSLPKYKLVSLQETAGVKIHDKATQKFPLKQTLREKVASLSVLWMAWQE